MARELHDGVAQTLYSINLSASTVLALLESKETSLVQGIAEDLLQQACNAQTQLRSLMQDLRSEDIYELRGGLAGALARQAADLQTRAGCEVSVSIAGEPDLAQGAKAPLARISREAVRNIRKHAHAKHVELLLETPGAEVVLRVSDDGKGFDAASRYAGHFGLLSMQEEASSAGGTLEAFSAPGRGTEIRVHVGRPSTSSGRADC